MMMTFSTFFESAILLRLESITLLFIVALQPSLVQPADPRLNSDKTFSKVNLGDKGRRSFALLSGFGTPPVVLLRRRGQCLGSPHGRLEVGFALAAAVDGQALLFPAVDRFAQLEEGDDAGWDRHPEGDEAEDQDR